MFCVAEGHFVACNDVKHKLGSYVKMVFPKWKKFMQKMPVKLGCPLVIIVTGAASRATDLIRYAIFSFTLGKRFKFHIYLFCRY